MIRPFKGILPKIASNAYIDPSAQVIGDVVIGERSSVWPNATVRGDVNAIRIGSETSVQDNCVLHVERNKYELHLGDRVVVGHSATLHGCTIENDALIGIGAIVLNGARIGRGSVIAAGALVAEGADVPAYSVVMGAPGTVRREVTVEERQRFKVSAQNYVELCQIYREEKA